MRGKKVLVGGCAICLLIIGFAVYPTAHNAVFPPPPPEQYSIQHWEGCGTGYTDTWKLDHKGTQDGYCIKDGTFTRTGSDYIFPWYMQATIQSLQWFPPSGATGWNQTDIAFHFNSTNVLLCQQTTLWTYENDSLAYANYHVGDAVSLHVQLEWGGASYVTRPANFTTAYTNYCDLQLLGWTAA